MKQTGCYLDLLCFCFELVHKVCHWLVSILCKNIKVEIACICFEFV